MTITSSPGIDTEEQAALRAAVRDLLRRQSGSAAVRKAIRTDTRYDPGLWTRLCQEIGVAALAVPEQFDGVGAGFMECHVVQEELDRTLTPSPMLGSAVLATQALLISADSDACGRLLPGIAAGRARSRSAGPVPPVGLRRASGPRAICCPERPTTCSTATMRTPCSSSQPTAKGSRCMKWPAMRQASAARLVPPWTRPGA